MSAAVAIQAGLATALRGHAPLATAVSGVYLGPPARAAFPYVAIGGLASSDWSHKTAQGREHRVTVSVWDDDASRALALTGQVEAAVEAMARDLDGHRVASLALIRTRMVRDGAGGPWAGITEYRVRTLEA